VNQRSKRSDGIDEFHNNRCWC